MEHIYKAAGILIKDRKILLERSRNSEMFMSPGGKLEPGETPIQALIRELYEEIQIKVEEKDLEEFGHFSATVPGNANRTVHMTVFMVNKWQGEITPDHEIEEIKWVTTSDLSQMKTGSIFELEVIPRLKERNLID